VARREPPTGRVRTLGADDVPAVVDVLCDAFEAYPVMRWVLGRHHGDPDRLRTLVHFFVMARVYRRERLLGVHAGDRLVAAALVSRPGSIANEALATLREEVWRTLGEDARSRYHAFGSTCAQFEVEVPHIHLNMIGVSATARGTGLGRVLLEHVHRLSEEDSTSAGVSLTTEEAANVPLYRYFGYRVLGEADVSPSLHTWSFFRSDPPDRRGQS